jgi:hypothetical protein
MSMKPSELAQLVATLLAQTETLAQGFGINEGSRYEHLGRYLFLATGSLSGALREIERIEAEDQIEGN